MKIVAKTDKGLKRENNQDSYAAGELSGGAVFAVVCDGMGGAAEGALASSVAVKVIREKISAGYSSGMSDLSIKSLLVSAVENANKAVYDVSLSDPEYEGMGTTVVACIATDEFVYIVYAGDSRAYLIRNGEPVQITRDHSVIQNMIENGEITPEEALDHPQKHVITRALGVDSKIKLDFCQEDFDDEILLLCSDGLTNFISVSDIGEILSAGIDDDSVNKLVDKANTNGGGDNITVVAAAK